MSGIDPIVFPAILAFSAAVMALAWIAQRATGNAGWVDVFWSLGTGAGGIAGALALAWWLRPAPPVGAQAWRLGAVCALAGLWSGRLGLHIAARTWHGREDRRYARFRDDWGDAFEARLFGLLMIQALAAALLAASIAIAANNPQATARIADAAGIAIVLGAIAGESVADAQMRRFRNDNSGHDRVCDTGLWGWSRHPNYVFEWLGWVGFAVIAIDWAGGGLGWPIGLASLLGPAMMYWLLTRVSGVPPLEREMLASRGDAFRDYQRRVPAFLPFLPARPADGGDAR